jgi:hypothetical protein
MTEINENEFFIPDATHISVVYDEGQMLTDR